MKRTLGTSILLALLILLAGIGSAAASAETPSAGPEETAEWTVLLYLCGSDLESEYGFATENLQDISRITYPEQAEGLRGTDNGEAADGAPKAREGGKVNVLIETGGSKYWHSENLNIDISASALQRWRFECHSSREETEGGAENGLYLMDTLPLKSMAEPETLTDFIRWGAAACPAKKIALVLWGHGDGARSGIFVDELHDGEIMYISELKEALKNAGTPLEAIVLDACLMGCVETAAAVEDSARWMIASEEIVPGRGTAVNEWLRELYANPSVDGRQLGRSICDLTMIKYDDEPDEQMKNISTWSVIDLSRIDALLEVCERFFREMGDIYRNHPEYCKEYAGYILDTEEYGDGTQNMRDLTSVFCNPKTTNLMDPALRSEMLNTLSEVVTYALRGSRHNQARGLSFCFPTSFVDLELDDYAENAPFPAYLAFLDAITEWNAPDWVFERTERLPAIDTVEALRMSVTREKSAQGMPGVTVKNENSNLRDVDYRLYWYNEEKDLTLLLGETSCIQVSGDGSDGGGSLFIANEPWMWTSVNGVPCCIQLIMEKNNRFKQDRLYNIPLQVGTDICTMRCGRVDRVNSEGETVHTYTIFGLWQGVNERQMLTTRSIKSLAQMGGQDFRLLYQTDTPGLGNQLMYEYSGKMTLDRHMAVEEKPLPAGIYYIQYVVNDLFERPFPLVRIEMRWDGEKATFPELDAWEGTVDLNVKSK